MSTESFNRIVKVRLYATIIDLDSGAGGTYQSISYNSGYTEFSSVQPDGNPGFRIKAKVSQIQAAIAFQTSDITLSLINLGQDSRALFQSKTGAKVEVLAGYDGNAKLIGSGNLLMAKPRKEGSDYILDVTIGDAHLALVSGSMNQSLKGEVSYQQVADVIFAALAPLGIIQGTVQIPDGGYQNGHVMIKSPLVELQELCKKMGCSFSVKNGAVNIIPVGQGDGSPVIILSEETGMIGIPELQPPGINGVPPGSITSQTQSTRAFLATPDNDIAFTSLLNSDLEINQLVRISSENVNGDYTVATIVHDIDSWAGPFYTHCEASKIQVSPT